MTRTTVKGIKRATKILASGRKVKYHYAWRGGPRFWSSDDPWLEGSADYWAKYQEAVQEREPSSDTFRQVIRAFLDSREYAKLAARTKKDYAQSVYHEEGIDAKFGSAPVDAFNNPKIRQIAYSWRDTFKSDRVADTRKTHLVSIVNWAVDKGYLRVNHLAGMSNLYTSDRSDVIWTPAEIEQFLDGAPERDIGPAPEWLRRMFVTALETGLRPGDLKKLTRQHVQVTKEGRRIYIRTAKRSRLVSIPVTPAMGEILDATPPDRLVILVGGDDKPYKDVASLGQAVSRRRDALGIRSDLRLQDTRGTAATRLFEADAPLREIAAHMGWSVGHTSKMIETYVMMNPDASVFCDCSEWLLRRAAPQHHRRALEVSFGLHVPWCMGRIPAIRCALHQGLWCGTYLPLRESAPIGSSNYGANHFGIARRIRATEQFGDTLSSVRRGTGQYAIP